MRNFQGLSGWRGRCNISTGDLWLRANYINPNRNALLQFDLANSDRTICTVEHTFHEAALCVTRPISKLWHRSWILTRNWKFQIRVLTSDRENHRPSRRPPYPLYSDAGCASHKL